MKPEDTKKISRRRLLKKLAIGGGVIFTANALPGKWKKPVIESVITSAHADKPSGKGVRDHGHRGPPVSG